MDVSHFQKIIDLDSLADWLNIQTIEGKKAFKEKSGIWQSNINSLQSLSYQFASVQSALQRIEQDNDNTIESIRSIYKELSSIEPELKSIMEFTSDLEKESASELIFFNSILQPLNVVPFILSIWSFIRV